MSYKVLTGRLLVHFPGVPAERVLTLLSMWPRRPLTVARQPARTSEAKCHYGQSEEDRSADCLSEDLVLLGYADAAWANMLNGKTGGGWLVGLTNCVTLA